MLGLLARYSWVLVPLAAAAGIVWWLVLQSARGNPRLRVRLAWEHLRRRLGWNRPLCRTCKWNNPQDCRHRQRPWAEICEDYRRR